MTNYKKIFEQINASYSKLPANYNPDEYGRYLRNSGSNNYNNTTLSYSNTISESLNKSNKKETNK